MAKQRCRVVTCSRNAVDVTAISGPDNPWGVRYAIPMCDCHHGSITLLDVTTERQRQALIGRAQGKSYRAIGDELGITGTSVQDSERTCLRHLYGAFQGELPPDVPDWPTFAVWALQHSINAP